MSIGDLGSLKPGGEIKPIDESKTGDLSGHRVSDASTSKENSFIWLMNKIIDVAVAILCCGGDDYFMGQEEHSKMQKDFFGDVEGGNIEGVKYFLKMFPRDVNAKNSKGFAPIQIALNSCKNEYNEMVKGKRKLENPSEEFLNSIEMIEFIVDKRAVCNKRQKEKLDTFNSLTIGNRGLQKRFSDIIASVKNNINKKR